MSAQSLNNNSLQLRELTISNEYDSKATGYVPKTTTISSNSINTNEISTNSVYLTGSNVVGNPSIQAANSDIYLITQTGGGVVLETPTSAVTLSSPTQNVLQVQGQLNCNTINASTSVTTGTLYTVNIANVYFGVSQNNSVSVPANGTANITLSSIPFLSNATSSAIASINATGSYASGVFVSNVEITAGATTNLVIQLVNTTGAAITVYNV